MSEPGDVDDEDETNAVNRKMGGASRPRADCANSVSILLNLVTK